MIRPVEKVFVAPPRPHDRTLHVSRPRLIDGRVRFSVDCDFPFDPAACGDAVRTALEYWKKRDSAPG